MDTKKKFEIDMKFVRAHLKGELPDGDEDVAISADNASRGLYNIRSFFYGTPLESVLDEMIGFCDEVAALADGAVIEDESED